MNLLLDVNNDLTFIDNKLQTVSGLDEMRQIVENAVNSFEGEWFFNLNQGIPYFQRIFVKSISMLEVEMIFIDYISELKGVIDILEMDMDFDGTTRSLRIKTKIKTTDGVLDFSSDQAGSV